MRSMRALAASALLLAVATAQQALPPLTQEQMAADLRQLAKETAAKWAYAEDRRKNAGIDVAQLAEAMIQRLPEVKDDAAFVALVCEIVSSLCDGHAFVACEGRERRPFRRWPFTVVDTADGLLVDEVLPAWNGEPVDLRRGDVLLEVDGVPVAGVIAAAERRTYASTPGDRRRWALRSVVFGDSDPRRNQVRRDDGSELVVTAAAAARHPEASKPPAVENRMLGDGVGYVRITTFAHHDAKAWKAATTMSERAEVLAKETEAIRAAFAAAGGGRALVLDLRGNLGGTDMLGMEVAACLLPKGSVYYELSSKGWFGWSWPGKSRLDVRGDPPRFPGKLVVLIDESVFSTSDNLCRCLDDLHPDVTFVGRATGGGTGASRPCVTLKHSGAVVWFCTLRVYGPKGELIEGRGTVPDVVVQRTRAGMLAGSDEDLEAALRLLR